MYLLLLIYCVCIGFYLFAGKMATKKIVPIAKETMLLQSSSVVQVAGDQEDEENISSKIT